MVYYIILLLLGCVALVLAGLIADKKDERKIFLTVAFLLFGIIDISLGVYEIYSNGMAAGMTTGISAERDMMVREIRMSDLSDFRKKAFEGQWRAEYKDGKFVSLELVRESTKQVFPSSSLPAESVGSEK